MSDAQTKRQKEKEEREKIRQNTKRLKDKGQTDIKTKRQKYINTKRQRQKREYNIIGMSEIS